MVYSFVKYAWKNGTTKQKNNKREKSKKGGDFRQKVGVIQFIQLIKAGVNFENLV
jgi:hypothetical protein